MQSIFYKLVSSGRRYPAENFLQYILLSRVLARSCNKVLAGLARSCNDNFKNISDILQEHIHTCINEEKFLQAILYAARPLSGSLKSKSNPLLLEVSLSVKAELSLQDISSSQLISWPWASCVHNWVILYAIDYQTEDNEQTFTIRLKHLYTVSAY